MGGGGGSTTCIKKKYTVHEIIITVHVVKINTLLCLEEEKILVRKDNACIYKNDYEYCRKIHKWWPCVACFVWKVKMQEYDWYMVLNTFLS